MWRRKAGLPGFLIQYSKSRTRRCHTNRDARGALYQGTASAVPSEPAFLPPHQPRCPGALYQGTASAVPSEPAFLPPHQARCPGGFVSGHGFSRAVRTRLRGATANGFRDVILRSEQGMAQAAPRYSTGSALVRAGAPCLPGRRVKHKSSPRSCLVMYRIWPEWKAKCSTTWLAACMPVTSNPWMV